MAQGDTVSEEFGMFSGFLSSDDSRVTEWMQTRTGETVRVCPDRVSEFVSESPRNMRELVCEFLPVPTK